MRPLRINLMLLLCVACATARADTGRIHITGFAYERGGDTLLYTEHHRVILDDDRISYHRVEYRAPEGDVIGTKTLDYHRHGFAPAFELQDLRDGYVEGAEYSEDGYRMYSRAGWDAELESATVTVSNNLVSDSGFDLYVRAQMDALLAGETEEFRMAVASEQAVLRFRARMQERLTLFGRPAIRIRIEPATLLRLLVDPIFLTYDAGNGELLRYEGLSNIRDKNGNRHDTRIDFPPERQQYVGNRER